MDNIRVIRITKPTKDRQYKGNYNHKPIKDGQYKGN
jgi:uncharacterized protein YlaI